MAMTHSLKEAASVPALAGHEILSMPLTDHPAGERVSIVKMHTGNAPHLAHDLANGFFSSLELIRQLCKFLFPCTIPFRFLIIHLYSFPLYIGFICPRICWKLSMCLAAFLRLLFPFVLAFAYFRLAFANTNVLHFCVRACYVCL